VIKMYAYSSRHRINLFTSQLERYSPQEIERTFLRQVALMAILNVAESNEYRQRSITSVDPSFRALLLRENAVALYRHGL